MYKLITFSLSALGLLFSLVLPAEAQSWRTLTSSRRLLDRSPLEVDIQYGAGMLRVGSADAGYLYQMEVHYDHGENRPLVEFDQDDRQLKLGTSSVDFGGHDSHSIEESSATIRLSRQVPIDLELSFGAGRAEIELGGIPLQRLELKTGASETKVSFSSANPIEAEEVTIEAGAADLQVMGLGNSRARRIDFRGGVGATVLDFSGASGNIEAEVQLGVGAVTLRLPRSHGVRLERSSFLASFTAPGLTREGGSYFSSNWASATQKLTIDLSAALGAIDIEWVD